VSFVAGIVPGCRHGGFTIAGRPSVVISFAVVGGVIARIAQVFGKEGNVCREVHVRPHMLPSDARGHHAADQGLTRSAADGGIGEAIHITNTFTCQSIQARSAGDRITEASQIRTVVLAGDP